MILVVGFQSSDNLGAAYGIAVSGMMLITTGLAFLYMRSRGWSLALALPLFAVFALVDLVITVDTSAAHLAGAMARPVWILLPFSPDWRWTLAGESSRWYGTARLFRQPSLGDWDSVIERLRSELVRLSRSG